MKPRREMRHHSPALEKQPITESPTMRSFVFNDITISVAFQAVRCSAAVHDLSKTITETEIRHR
jgi:hypothetical protein